MYVTEDCEQPLQTGQTLCAPCAQYRRSRCNRSLRKARYSLHADICEACFRKMSDTKQQAGGGIVKKQAALNAVFTDVTLGQPSNTLLNIAEYVKSNDASVQNSLIEAIVDQRWIYETIYSNFTLLY